MKTKRGILSREDIQVVRVLAPLTYNSNAPDKIGRTAIYRASIEGHKEIVKILAHLSDNPNALLKSLDIDRYKKLRNYALKLPYALSKNIYL